MYSIHIVELIKQTSKEVYYVYNVMYSEFVCVHNGRVTMHAETKQKVE